MLPRPKRIIVPQYAAPKGTSLLAAAELLGDSRRAVAAQMVDLAVRGAITIAPLDRSGLRRSGYVLTMRSNRNIGEDEFELLAALIPGGIGAERKIRRGRNGSLGEELRTPHRRAVARLLRDGRARERTWFERVVTPWRRQPVEPTPQGWRTVDHLWGIHDYMALAEKDRLNFLQSPGGALQKYDEATGKHVLLLNERLLPFAILFAMEKEWAKQLDLQYREVAASGFDIPLDLIDPTWALGSLEDLPDLDAVLDLSGVLEGVGQLIGGAIEGALSGF